MAVKSNSKDIDRRVQGIKSNYIPMAWKKWYAFLFSIATKDITPDYCKTDDFALVLDDLLSGFKDTLSRSHLGIYQGENKEGAIEALQYSARKIHFGYLKVKEMLQVFPEAIQKTSAMVDEDCLGVLQIINSAEQNQIEKNVEDTYFDSEFMLSLYNSSANCLKFTGLNNLKPDFELFFALCNLYESNIVHKDDPDKLTHDDFTPLDGVRISPVSGREMSFFALLVVLLLYRNRNGDPFYGYNQERDYWAEEMSQRIAWTSTQKTNSCKWVYAYYTTDYFLGYSEIKVPVSVTVEDKDLLTSILERPVYDGIWAPRNLADNNVGPYRFDKISVLKKIAIIENNRLNALFRLFHLVDNETKYLLTNIDKLSSMFVSDYIANQIREDNIQTSLAIQRGKDDISNLLVCDSLMYAKSPSDLLLELYKVEDFIDINFKPKVTDDVVKQIVYACIISNLELKAIIKETIEDEQFINGQNVEDKRDVAVSIGSSNSIFDRLIDLNLIDNTGNILMPKAKIARLLVAQGIVQPTGGWDQEQYLHNDFYRYHNLTDTNYRHKDIKYLTELLQEDIKPGWKKLIDSCEGRLNFKGKPLTAEALSRAFYDKDVNFIYRREAFSRCLTRVFLKNK